MRNPMELKVVRSLVGSFLALCAVSCGGEATTQSADEVAEAPSVLSSASTCHYTVTGNGVAVRESPSLSSVILKQKNRGDRVTGPCRHASGSGYVWAAVHCNCARDDIGWMVHLYLDP